MITWPRTGLSACLPNIDSVVVTEREWRAGQFGGRHVQKLEVAPEGAPCSGDTGGQSQEVLSTCGRPETSSAPSSVQKRSLVEPVSLALTPIL